MSDLARLPVHAVDASQGYVVALTGANIVLYKTSGELVATLDARVDAGVPGDASVVAFPRLCAISPSEAYLAVASDDKTLRVWRTDELAYGKEVVRQRLAKRAGTLQWTTCALHGEKGEEVVIADKFGDVWSFPVDASVAPEALPDAAEEDPAEAAVKPRLGHVSMVTCLAFLGQRGEVPASIVSADRDEHIRISRWGAKRAGHVVQEYLLGSSSFVGALLPIEQATAEKSGFDSALLVSADGGACLRVWAQHGKYGLQSVVALPDLSKHVAVDASVERRRERVASNVALRDAFDPTAKPPKRAREDENEETAPLVLTRLLLVNDTTILATWEGASVLALIPLASLRASGTLSDVYVYDVEAPILSVAYVAAHGTLYVACDDRPDIGHAPALRAYTVGATIEPASSSVLDALNAPPADVPTSAPELAKHAVLTAAAASPRAFGTSSCLPSASRDPVQALSLPCAHDVAQAGAGRGRRRNAVPLLFPRPAPRGCGAGDGAAVPVWQARSGARQEPGDDPAAVCSRAVACMERDAMYMRLRVARKPWPMQTVVYECRRKALRDLCHRRIECRPSSRLVSIRTKSTHVRS